MGKIPQVFSFYFIPSLWSKLRGAFQFLDRFVVSGITEALKTLKICHSVSSDFSVIQRSCNLAQKVKRTPIPP